MRLVYSLYNLDIQIEENMINILIVENPEIFSVVTGFCCRHACKHELSDHNKHEYETDNLFVHNLQLLSSSDIYGSITLNSNISSD